MPTYWLLQNVSSVFSNASFICLYCRNMLSTFMSNYSLQGATSKYALVHVNLKVATPTKISVSITYWEDAWAHTKLCRCTTLLVKLFLNVHLILGQKIILVNN